MKGTGGRYRSTEEKTVVARNNTTTTSNIIVSLDLVDSR